MANRAFCFVDPRMEDEVFFLLLKQAMLCSIGRLVLIDFVDKARFEVSQFQAGTLMIFSKPSFLNLPGLAVFSQGT